jgi:hypothetical protein
MVVRAEEEKKGAAPTKDDAEVRIMRGDLPRTHSPLLPTPPPPFAPSTSPSFIKLPLLLYTLHH